MASALAAALRAVPAAFRQHVGALEAFFAALVLAPPAALPAGLRARGCECLALLPRVAGDGAAWSALAQRLLCSMHAALDAAFQGLDDPALAAAAKCVFQQQPRVAMHSVDVLLHDRRWMGNALRLS